MPYRDYNHKMNEYMKARYARRRGYIIEQLGGKCAICDRGGDLEIDHIDPFTKTAKISKLWSYSDEKLLEELKKCQLLCHDCHRGKSMGPNGDISKKMRARNTGA